MAYLAVFIPQSEAQRFELGETNVLGRSSSCDIWVNDSNVSRRHCKLQREGESWVLLDMDSTNGTWLDAARVRRYALRDGETFYIGDTRIVFHGDKFVEHRPADPNEASHFAEVAESVTNHDSSAETVAGVRAKRALPSARATVVNSSAGRSVRAQSTPGSIAFRRPPARPILKDLKSGGWIGALISRFRTQ